MTRRQRACDGCGQSYGSQAHHGVRFCSMACYLAAPRPERPPRPRVIPTPEAVTAEMLAAYAAVAAEMVVREVGR